MEKTEKVGRYLVSIAIVLSIGLSSFFFVRSVHLYGTQELFIQLLQISIYLFLAWSTYKGNDGPRKILGVLSIMGSIIGLLLIINLGYFSWWVLISYLYTLSTASAGITLLFSRKVKRFMQLQREISSKK